MQSTEIRGLLRVIQGEMLIIPRSLRTHGGSVKWLDAGGIVDADAPGIADLLDGQHHKLEKAPEGSTAHALPLSIARYTDSKTAAPAQPKREVLKEKASEAAKVHTSGGIQKPDAPRGAVPSQA